MPDDFYDLLEISPDASRAEIREAFREQVNVYHPDVNDDERATEQFATLKTAYDILSDPDERRAYDRLGHEAYLEKRTNRSGSVGLRGVATGALSDAPHGRLAAATQPKGTRTLDAPETATGGVRAEGAPTSDGGQGPMATSASSAYEPVAEPSSNPVVRWWSRRNLSLPLLWLSIVTYLVGLVHFSLANASALYSIVLELLAARTSITAHLSVLFGERYGLQTPLAFVVDLQPVAPPINLLAWYALVGGGVALVLASLLVRRVYHSHDWKQLTANETIVVALAVGAAATLVGGLFLAGALLMPVLFGLILRRTRQLPGWAPSYWYVAAVCAPLVGFALQAAGYRALAIDLLAFVVVPIVGALALPVRLACRRWFGL